MNQPMPLLLVVEDNNEDYTTLLRVFRKLAFSQRVERCANAEECFDYLYALKKYQERNETAPPLLLLLDLNLPGKDGHAILRQIKAVSSLRHIPIVIITTSTDPRDIQTCYMEGANSYLIKTVDYVVYEQTIRHFLDYWFHAVRLPFSAEVAL